jgi:lipopolysaccharide export system protein LptA
LPLKYLLSVMMIILAVGESAIAQVNPVPISINPNNDSTKIITIIHADTLIVLQGNDSTSTTKLTGNVLLRQGNTTFSCDSALQNNITNIIDAYGHIHINQADSINTYGDYLHYLGNDKEASLQKNIMLTDGKMVLTTSQLDYNLNTHIGIYSNGGKLVTDSTVLTSQLGYYYADLKEAYFRHDVVLTDPQYTLKSDSLQYNTMNHTATIVTPTIIHIQNSPTIIYTSDGYYNTDSARAMFAGRSVIVDSSQNITADSMFYFKKANLGIGKGNVIWNDTSQHISVLANYTETNDSTKTLFATQKPLMINRMKNDTLYMAADTLFSGLINPADTARRALPNDSLHSITDTTSIKPLIKKDTAVSKTDTGEHRYFIAYHQVRIYSDSLQGVSDSLYYSFADSTFRFFTNPVMWYGDNQLSADTIYLHTQNQQASKIDLVQNAIIINQTGPDLYNQVAGKNIYGYFKDNAIYWMHVNGDAESIYYAKDDNGDFIGVNRATGAIIDMYFKDKKLKDVVFRQSATATFSPVKGLNPGDYQLKNFSWQQNRRPKSKSELMK